MAFSRKKYQINFASQEIRTDKSVPLVEGKGLVVRISSLYHSDMVNASQFLLIPECQQQYYAKAFQR